MASEFTMINSVKWLTKVKKGENIERTTISRPEEIINNSLKSCLSAVKCTEARVKGLVECVIIKKGMKSHG